MQEGGRDNKYYKSHLQALVLLAACALLGEMGLALQDCRNAEAQTELLI